MGRSNSRLRVAGELARRCIPSRTASKLAGYTRIFSRSAAAHSLVLSLALLLTACAPAQRTIGERLGPTKPADVTVESWSYEGSPAYRLTTAHYTIYTTIRDPDYSDRIAQVLEAGFDQYRQFLPNAQPSPQRMNCYVFDTRSQWVDFTRRNTGVIANIYLQINRGGYTLRDWFVAYDIGQIQTYSVAAHEGWHQFAYRNFVGRLPPFLEEGIACMFEDVRFKSNLPMFNLSVNPMRAKALRTAIDSHRLIPLEELITLHAGQIVGRTGATIETFYAENWAFAKFLWEGENGKYRPALLRLIADTAAGISFDRNGAMRLGPAEWNPAAVAPLLGRYLNMTMPEISEHYRVYIKQIAYDEISAEFAS